MDNPFSTLRDQIAQALNQGLKPEFEKTVELDLEADNLEGAIEDEQLSNEMVTFLETSVSILNHSYNPSTNKLTITAYDYEVEAGSAESQDIETHVFMVIRNNELWHCHIAPQPNSLIVTIDEAPFYCVRQEDA